MSLVIANANECAEFAVIGVDLPSEASYWKIGDIKTQNCPVISSDPLVAEYQEGSREQCLLRNV